MLAGRPRHDPPGLDQLLDAAADEAGTTAPAATQDIVQTWVASRWLDDHDRRAAVRTVAHLGETNLSLNLGHFIGLDDEWSGNWVVADSELHVAMGDLIEVFQMRERDLAQRDPVLAGSHAPLEHADPRPTPPGHSSSSRAATSRPTIRFVVALGNPVRLAR
jgi:hypothetical protein